MDLRVLIEFAYWIITLHNLVSKSVVTDILIRKTISLYCSDSQNKLYQHNYCTLIELIILLYLLTVVLHSLEVLDTLFRTCPQPVPAQVRFTAQQLSVS